jgi:ribonuclease P protein component
VRQKRRRLSRSAEFDRVYRDGESVANRYLVLYAFPRQDPGEETRSEDVDAEQRLGVSVGRRVGGAVVRNRVKRLLRQAFWSVATPVTSDHDYVIVARPDTAALAEREGVTGFERELRALIDQLLARRGGESQIPETEAGPVDEAAAGRLADEAGASGERG